MSAPAHGSAGGARRGLRALPAKTCPDRVRDEGGTVTAETAVVLPVVVAFALGLVWLVSLGVTQVRVVDAARETARAVARDETHGVAYALGMRVAPDGSSISILDRGDSVRVTVTSGVRGPGGLFRFLPPVQVDAEAVAAKEPS